MDLFKVYVWPNGTYCEEDELEGYLSWMSDDFMELYVTCEQLEFGDIKYPN